MSSIPQMLEDVYVSDTHALIWYLTADPRLSAFAKSIFEAGVRDETRLILSAISIAEMYYANKKWELFADFRQVYQDLKIQPQYQFVDYQADDTLDFDRDAAVPEMHDRIIAGLARRLGVPLITNDPLIRKAGIVEIVW